jgi:hypothetical protein
LGRGLPSVLLVAHLFHPIDGLAIQRLLNGDMCHCRRGRCPVPMLLAGRKPDHAIRSDLLNSPAPTLYPPAAGRDDAVSCQICGGMERSSELVVA